MGRARIGVSSSSSGVIPTHTVSMSQSVGSRNFIKSLSPDKSGDGTPNQLSKIPQPKFKSTPILENSDESKENQPAIDAKYLPQCPGPAPAPLKTRNWSTSPADPFLPTVKARISKDAVKPHSALVAAYFPTQK
ncbi:hypothetical protein EB796_024271 [Bugula neritina]|uniref:Uncharacterized protein n=1 Tax=Bugula neritina TaxID=10212 RepID=A0A7J7IVG9_BUGNE|nr:hypothetical protein EB796_024271 [Bugula neritina]